MPSPSIALLRTQSDSRLVALAAGGHERAFEAIVERYRRQLLRHARRHLPEARAEDALQQAFVSAWTALRRGDEVRELRPWLHRIVHNTALNALRAPGYDYEELRATLQGGGGPAELAERRALVQGTLAGLAALPERQREALLRIAVEGRSQDEVAEQLGLSQGAVRQLVHRARSALRAAATAVVPLPLATWLATAGAGRGDVAIRVGELVAGAGGSATLAKAGAVAVIAGGAVAGPAVVHDVSERGKRQPAEAAASARSERAGRDSPTVRVAPAVAVAPATAALPAAVEQSARDHDRSGSGGEDRGSREDEGPGSRGGGDDSGGRGDDDRGSSGGHDRGSGANDDEDGESGRRGGHRGSGGHGDEDGESGRRGGHGGSGGDGDDDDDSGSRIEDDRGSGSGGGGDDADDESGDGGSGPDGGDEGSGGGLSGQSGADDEPKPPSGDDDDEDASSGSGGGDPVLVPSVAPTATPEPDDDESDDKSGSSGD